jgi:hypothetical protein
LFVASRRLKREQSDAIKKLKTLQPRLGYIVFSLNFTEEDADLDISVHESLFKFFHVFMTLD